jgi:hypothetical protein
MRAIILLACAIAVFTSAGCAAIIGQVTTIDAIKKAKACMADVHATPEYQMVAPRLWQFDDTDTAAKLSDPKPLGPAERNALVQVHNKIVLCRQIIILHDNQFAAWETPYWQDYFQRSDEIFYKLASGELPVGIANKMAIESQGKFQADVSRGHADAVQVAEVQQQQAAEAMMQAGAQLAASQPRSHMTTTNCTWMGNTLNCTSMR